MSLTGIKDVDREILKYVDDKELLEICTINKKTWNEVCDDAFLRRRLLNKYLGIEKYKSDRETWKQFLLTAIYYISKLEEEFSFSYSSGDFKKQYTLLNIYKGGELLYTAAGEGELEIIKYLVSKGLDIHYENNYAFQEASEKGHLEIVKYLLEHGADIHADDDYALIFASVCGHLEVVKYLVEHRANIHANDDDSVISASGSGHLEIVKYLLDHGANIHATREKPLRDAITYGKFEVVQYLIDQGANIGIASQTAREYGHDKIVKYLEELKIE